MNYFIITRFWKPPEYQANMMQKKKNRAATDAATVETKMWTKMNTC